MELSQGKLTSNEWGALEIKVNPKELRILNLIRDGFDNVNVSFNETLTLIRYSKINEEHELYHNFFYKKYFEGEVKKMIKKNNLLFEGEEKVQKKKEKKLKKAQLIRINNIDKKLEVVKDSLFEFKIINYLKQMLKNKNNKSTMDKFYYYYYTLTIISKMNLPSLNSILMNKLRDILKITSKKVKMIDFVKNVENCIEKNKDLEKCREMKLYAHQKEIFTICKSDDIKLIFYKAPTGTGKTITPIGLSQKYKIIFVCAARHVGLQLAKSLISCEKKIAIAFGCKGVEGIRLHYFAAKDFIKNRRTGGIFRVDNTVGDNVEVIISDIESYIYAMNYMMAFNKKEDILWYWDEPTITLDYENHEFHNILKRNWKENMIPNIVLSSATLPDKNELSNFCQSFVMKFNSMNIYEISSDDCKRTIPLVNTEGKVVLPHYIYSTKDEIKSSVRHLKKYPTILRYFDLKEISKFIVYVNKHIELKKSYKLEKYFETIQDIDSVSLKQYYIKLLGCLKDDYARVSNYFKETQKTIYNSTIKITTADSYTLTNGPTIYMAENIEKIALYCLKLSSIPERVLEMIMNDIDKNEDVAKKINELEREVEADENKDEEGKKGKINEKNMSNKKRELLKEISCLRRQIKRIQLPARFVPNTFEHLKLWNKLDRQEEVFTCSIDDEVIRKIMMLDVDRKWKLLLMMGIGVFIENSCKDYNAIMFDLASTQKLFLIIASSDYIYGTNYQFSHGYIGKDLNLSQEKIIQALGRIGRSGSNETYSIRLRNDIVAKKLFEKEVNKMEVRNMNLLFV